MLDAGIEKTLTDFTQELRQLLGEELISVVLYGSATGANFVPRQSDFNVVIVIQKMGFATLQKLQPRMEAWHALGFAVPLVIDPEFLMNSRDVFPMEFSDIQKHHVLLWGEDVFHSLSIHLHHLRFLAEHEARSKLLRLQALYFERGNEPHRLRHLMLDSLKTFLILMRHLLYLQERPSGQTYSEVLADFEHSFQVTFPRMRQMLAIRARTRQWPDESAQLFFRDYLTEVQHFVRLLDRLHTNAPTSR